MLAANQQDPLDWIKKALQEEYNVKELGEVKTIISWQITRSPSTLKIDQSAFIRDLVEEEGMRDCNPVNTPMKTGNFIEMQGEDDYEEVDLKVYQRLIGKLMYLSCGTRPDISFVVGQLSKRNADPRVGHLKAAKRVVRYLKGTMHLGLMYGSREDAQSQPDKETKASTSQAKAPVSPPPFGLVGYADSNYAGDPEDRKSVMGNCFFLHGAIVSWCSKKQRTVSTSTTEAEYIALGHGARESVWIRRFLNELKVEAPIGACLLHGDNETSIILTKNAESQARTKHIDVQHHYIRELVADKEVKAC